MKYQIGNVLLSCVMSAALLSGCTSAISSTAPGSASESEVQPEQEASFPPSSSEAPVSESIRLPQAPRSQEDQFENQRDGHEEQTLTELKEICQSGYVFFKECQIGQEGFLTYDLSNQFVRGEQQYIALASINSKESFLAHCTELFSDAFIDQNVNPWFESEDARFVEERGFLYYRTPSGTGLVTPLAANQAEVERQTSNEVSIIFPLWNSQTREALNGSVRIVLVADNETWKINEIKESMN